MRKLKLLLTIISLLILPLSSCNKHYETITNEVEASFQGRKEYSFTTEYNSDIFLNDSKVFSKDLALLSYALSLQADSKTKVDSFFTSISFSNIDHYGYEDTNQKMGLSIASTFINDTSIIALTFRASHYYVEWANNFEVGKAGDHKGFSFYGDKAYTYLREYLNKNNNRCDKLWISGYSRGGGLANILAYKILENNLIKVKDENMFVYTFESPQTILKENAKDYKNVFNIISSGDIVPYLAPTSYNLARCGIDIDIFSNNIDKYMEDFDISMPLNQFVPYKNHFTNEQELVLYFLNLLTPGENEVLSKYTLKTRESYNNLYEEPIVYLITLFASMNNSSIIKLIDTIQKNYLTAIGATNGIYNLVKPILEEDNIIFDDNILKSSLEILSTKFYNEIKKDILIFTLNQSSSIKRMIEMHMPEVIYVLLKNASI